MEATVRNLSGSLGMPGSRLIGNVTQKKEKEGGGWERTLRPFLIPAASWSSDVTLLLHPSTQQPAPTSECRVPSAQCSAPSPQLPVPSLHHNL